MISWGTRRKWLIEALLALGILAVVVLVAFFAIHKAPSCTDGKQNQGETGVDCGGSCPYACSVSEVAPTVRFIRTLTPQPGRTDIIAYIDNPSSDAGIAQAHATIELYDANNALVIKQSGDILLPPSTTVPLFIPGFYNGSHVVTHAFLTFDPVSLKYLRTMKKLVAPVPSSISIQQSATPTITATLTNPVATPLLNLTVVATVFDSANNAIAASQTVVQKLPGQGTASVVFTWNQPFSSPPARVEILREPLP